MLPAARGDILDRNGQPLAASIDGLMLAGDPQMTDEKAPEIAKFLDQRLDIDYFTVLKQLREHKNKDGEQVRFEYLARHVPSTLATDVLQESEDRGFEGLTVRPDAVRSYPGHDIAANLVGFMGTDKPYGGLEEIFNNALSGTDGSEKYEVGAGNRIPLGDNTTVPAVDGQDLHTTIDRDLQWYTQRVLRQAVEKANGSSGIAIILDSRTGAVLALADHPTFDAEDPGASESRTGGPARSTSPTSPARWRRSSPLPRSSTPARSTRTPGCWCPASCTVRTASSTTTGTTG